MILSLTYTFLPFVLMLDGEAFMIHRGVQRTTITQGSQSSPISSSTGTRLFVQQWQPPSNNNNNNDDFNSNINNNNLASLGEIEDPYIDLETRGYMDGTKLDNAIFLGLQNFKRQGTTIGDQFLETIRIRPRDPYSPPDCLQLTLSNRAVVETERRREAAGGRVNAHPISRALYNVGCLFVDRLFEERPIERFWFLELISRVPYFSYVSMLQLYEILGWFRADELRKVHAAEDWNKLHHLLIMETLGGNRLWSTRFLAYHVAIFYYWHLLLVYLVSPRIAYQFLELLESHAVDTYATFINENRSNLAALPAPQIAKSYYVSGDLYVFDDFQVSRQPGSRRPPCDTLFDTFVNIATDEGEHVKTVIACQDYSEEYGMAVVSPHVQSDDAQNRRMNLTPAQLEALEDDKRTLWKKWSIQVNNEWR